MTTRFLKPFVRDYCRLPEHIQRKTDRQLKRLKHDLRHPGVKARKMTGVGDIWEGRVNGSYRFTFQIVGEIIILRRIGTHTIYRKP
jgi:mRNA-degrading endonuclease RelE of RelBE toxin-antitoxin system